ncbi:GNAT family N-acetyltransferase [Clostridium cellulovorans]|uniref:GCN5-related N-acetyltransferase n=1 Tax=Clostridium cellulovorans (strain ATCC 35296 / DSM 3052 / OCM 3 / 743B) TaxID=573061 RepID=D9SNA7_CLOC7|nr:GNAT family protein [Clostridium cellulovorans]ADL53899.1 GCN5-related N-acetyltransferase [Clostridium cellulovorans 743B]
MAIIEAKKYELSLGEVTLESAKGEDAALLILFIKKADSETDFLLRESDEFNISYENEKKFIDDKRKNENELFITAKIDGEVVGTLGFAGSSFRRGKHKGQFGIVVLREYWGYGIGSKMLNLLIEWADNVGLVKIALEVDADNERAIKIYKKFGFEVEGILKYNKHMGQGVYKDSILMARINHGKFK